MRIIPEESVDLVVRLLLMRQMHKTYPVTGTTCTVVASMIPGTVANRLSRSRVVQRGRIRIGHPAGIITPEGKVVFKNGGYPD
jgi:2-methylaconitate cis-trans-isomerase PrpF